jgi:hypothetical protein
MKLGRHMDVVIGDGLEASSIALHGRGNARLAWFLATAAGGHDACHLGRRPSVHTERRPRAGNLWPRLRQRPDRSVSCPESGSLAWLLPRIAPFRADGLWEEVVNTDTAGRPGHPWLCSAVVYIQQGASARQP